MLETQEKEGNDNPTPFGKLLFIFFLIESALNHNHFNNFHQKKLHGYLSMPSVYVIDQTTIDHGKKMTLPSWKANDDSLAH